MDEWHDVDDSLHYMDEWHDVDDEWHYMDEWHNVDDAFHYMDEWHDVDDEWHYMDNAFPDASWQLTALTLLDTHLRYTILIQPRAQQGKTTDI
jgi:hypothetical protein